MSLHTMSLVDTDYDNILVGWWEAYGFSAPAKEFLPDNARGGIMVYDGERPVCAGFIYETNSLTAWSEWIISDKTYKGKDRGNSISLLLQSLEELARDKGFKFIFANNNNKALVRHYKKNGYTVGCTNSTEVVKAI
tara:strand:+ start:284 stop:691 length:408 start_codon:yes stop_codon:yes gene_type:complete